MRYMTRDTSLFPTNKNGPQFPDSLSPYIAAVVFESFLYGLYCILFTIAGFVLHRSPVHMPRLYRVLIISSVLMFSLATADMIYTLVLLFHQVLGDGNLRFRNLYPKYVMYVTNNVIADSLLLYRCYMIWGRNNYLLIGPLLLLIATTVCGYVFEGRTPELSKHSWIYLSMTFTFNVGVTTLAAGRIWWIGYKAREILGREIARQYNSTIAILVESGIIYSIYVTLDLAFQYYPSVNVILDTGLIQVVGIMPTLLIVQVGLGRATQDMEATISAMRFAAGVKTHRPADTDPDSGGQAEVRDPGVGTGRGRVFAPEVNLNSSSGSLERQSAERPSMRALGLRTGMAFSSGSGIGGSATLYSPITNDTPATQEARIPGLRPSEFQTVPLTPKSSKSFTRLSRAQSTRSATPANLTPKSSTPSLWSKVTIYRKGRGESGDTEESQALVPMKEDVLEEDLERGVVKDPPWVGESRGDAERLGGNDNAR